MSVVNINSARPRAVAADGLNNLSEASLSGRNRNSSDIAKGGDQAPDLFELYREAPHDITLRNALVLKYFPLVEKSAKVVARRMPAYVSVEELTSSGVLGLIDALKAFDPGRGIKFESFSIRRIRGAMLDEMRKEDWVPRIARTASKKLKAATRILYSKLGRNPTDNELCAHLGISDKILKRWRTIVKREVSIDAKASGIPSCEEFTIGDILADPKSLDPSKKTEMADFQKMILRGLNKLERSVVSLYCFEDRSMKEIAEQLNISEAYCSQLASRLASHLINRWRIEKQATPQRHGALILEEYKVDPNHAPRLLKQRF